MSDRLKTVLAHPDSAQRACLKDALCELGHEILCECISAKEMKESVCAHRPDLIIAAVELKDGDGIQALVDVSDEVSIPAIVVTKKTSLEVVERAMLDHVMAYLIEPVEKQEIKPTIHLVLKRFEQFQELQSEVESLRQALTERKTIERAKGLLMKNDDLDEEAAYKKLRRMATDTRSRMYAVAQQILGETAKAG
jgi:AmiR/NasT family two-component response regulator